MNSIHWFGITARMNWRSSLWLFAMFCLMAAHSPARADLRASPVWYDQNAVGTAPDWHFRVAISVPAGASVNSTIKADVDFASVGASLGGSGTLDVNSLRIVRPNGTLAVHQEYSDTVFAGTTDAVGNNRGEIRFILEDSGPVTYWLYFDISENGAKPPNPQPRIGGNFEASSSGTAQPSGWNSPTGTGVLDAQVRPAETVSVTTNGAGASPVTKSTNGNPLTGAFSYLIGARSADETAGSTTSRRITRTISVPATNPGNFTIRWRPEGWDSELFDLLSVDLIGATTVQVVGPTHGNYATAPFSPNFGGGQISSTTSGYGNYNHFDLTTGGTHTLGMTQIAESEVWFTRSVSLAPFAGQTITLSITSTHVEEFRTWFHIDDVEWSVVSATVSTAQGFGVNITAPTTPIAPNQPLTIRATVDATPTAATNPVTANIYDGGGTLVQSGIKLFNDGTHGDAVAGDALWANDGTDAANPTIAATTNMTNWQVRVFARDSSTSLIGAQNGLIRGPGSGTAAETQANFWNIDEQTYSVEGAALTVTKTSAPISDPVSGAANPKAIPGAVIRYCILIANAGPATASSVTATDALPATLNYVAGSMRSGGSCDTATTVEDDDSNDGGEGDGVTSNIVGATLNFASATIANTQTVALVFDVIIDDGTNF
jgi:uncharacterized repeat protein (TIGR01451 family)